MTYSFALSPFNAYGYGSDYFGNNGGALYDATIGTFSDMSLFSDYPSYEYGIYGMSAAERREWANMTPEEREAKRASLYQSRLESAAQRQERFSDINYSLAQRREDQALDRQIGRAQRQNAMQSPLDAARIATVNLQLVIRDNRKDEVMTMFNELKAELGKIPQYQKMVRKADGTYAQEPLSDKEMNAKAREFYAQVTGSDLLADVDANLSGSFAQGLKKGLTFGLFGDTKDSDMLKEEIAGLDRDRGNAAMSRTGGALGGAITGAGAGALIGAKKGGKYGAIIGAIIGGLTRNISL